MLNDWLLHLHCEPFVVTLIQWFTTSQQQEESFPSSSGIIKNHKITVNLWTEHLWWKQLLKNYLNTQTRTSPNLDWSCHLRVLCFLALWLFYVTHNKSVYESSSPHKDCQKLKWIILYPEVKQEVPLSLFLKNKTTHFLKLEKNNCIVCLWCFIYDFRPF